MLWVLVKKSDIGCWIFGKVFNSSKCQFPHLDNGDNSSPFLAGIWGDEHDMMPTECWACPECSGRLLFVYKHGSVLKRLTVSLETGEKSNVESGGNTSFPRGTGRRQGRGGSSGYQVVFTADTGQKPGMPLVHNCLNPHCTPFTKPFPGVVSFGPHNTVEQISLPPC